MLRGGAFKPRTKENLTLSRDLDWKASGNSLEFREETGLPIVTELMSPDHLDIFNER